MRHTTAHLLIRVEQSVHAVWRGHLHGMTSFLETGAPAYLWQPEVQLIIRQSP